MSNRDEVVKYYPNAVSVNVGCKNGSYYQIHSDNRILGKGKNKRCAWRSAYKNINQ